MKHPHLSYAPDVPAEKAEKPKKGRRERDVVADMVRDKDELSRILGRILAGVSYSDFLTPGTDGEDPLAANVFLELRGLCLIDVFMDHTDGEIAGKLGVSPSRLATLREHPLYQAMREALKASAIRLSSPKTMDDLAEAGEREIAHQLFDIATGKGSVRDRQKALDAFADRRSAKKGREPETKAVTFPEGLLEFMKIALEMTGMAAGGGQVLGEGVRRELTGATGPVIEISASRLNVPESPEEN